MGALRILLLAAALVALATSPAMAQQRSEPEIKAAYLYQFGGFVDWPPESFTGADSRFVIGVLNADPVAAALEAIAGGREVQGRPVTVRRLTRGDPLPRLHVLFVGRSESARLGDIQSAVRGRPVLLVTDAEETPGAGAMINFVMVDNRIRFDVVLPPAEREGLRISARLLAVARRVVNRTS